MIEPLTHVLAASPTGIMFDRDAGRLFLMLLFFTFFLALPTEILFDVDADREFIMLLL